MAPGLNGGVVAAEQHLGGIDPLEGAGAGVLREIEHAGGEALLFDAAFTGDSRKDCEAVAGGACWAFIQERLHLFVYGFYPEAERWRVDVSFVLLLVTLYFVGVFIASPSSCGRQ